MLANANQFIGASFGWRCGFSFADHAGNEDHRQDGEDIGLHGTCQEIERHQRDRHEEPGERQHDADHEDPAHHVAEQTDEQREGAREGFDEIERNHDWVGRRKGREIAANTARADAEPDHPDEDNERQRGVGLDVGRRRHRRQE